MGLNKYKAILVLRDGLVFEGQSFGAPGEAMGEVVFNTSMTGYQEILTDPSYKGQIVTMTSSQIGNYGVNDEDPESRAPYAEGFIVREHLEFASNWRSRKSLGQYLKEHGITAIEGIDTRALTRHLRQHGAQTGIISTSGAKPEELLEKVRQYPDISRFDFVKMVSAKEPFAWKQQIWRWPEGVTEGCSTGAAKKVVAYDFGIKFNILRNLASAGFQVTVVPAATPAEQVLEMKPDGVVLSNGPGDPERTTYGVEAAKKLMGKVPIFGICLGHQILGLAMGGRTYKLKFGHHGGNHPVMELATGRVEITSQNHNYCVDITSLHGKAFLTHKNLYDGTEEGMRHMELPIMSVQHHPEAAPGPNDSNHLFKDFMAMINGRQINATGKK
ncbi:MAG: glutamine-hydrolyzing carbamoyl-phosphate synthase small subunit [Actinomycetota bacterium]|nr:glutamine-hydrolyzing carbamoyl-phosphate synthase small subunit [Actinomycetota bacterium]